MAIRADTLDSLVPITQFNKGLAAKIFNRLKVERQIIVLKNNKPTAVIISPEEYKRLSEAEENLRLLQIAGSRLTPGWESRVITDEDFWVDSGITDEEMANTAVPEIE